MITMSATTTVGPTDDQLQKPQTSPAPSGGAIASIAGRQLLMALRVLLAMTVVLGIGYPAVVLGLGQLIAPAAANGSLLTGPDGQVVGSSLIGQDYAGDQWFKGRPSAAGDGYDAMSSGGTNLAADSPELAQQIADRRTEIAAANGVDPASVPADALTASGSGLDPDISPAYALLQANRVAAARGVPEQQVNDLVQSHIQGRTLGFIGEERVNVLELNLALDQLAR
jgi:potassium-transporting ATPase KdpC subunit